MQLQVQAHDYAEPFPLNSDDKTRHHRCWLEAIRNVEQTHRSSSTDLAPVNGSDPGCRRRNPRELPPSLPFPPKKSKPRTLALEEFLGISTVEGWCGCYLEVADVAKVEAERLDDHPDREEEGREHLVGPVDLQVVFLRRGQGFRAQCSGLGLCFASMFGCRLVASRV